jgi:spore germination protein YaaH
LGRNPYSGVTIDFEGLRNADKENFNAFLSELGTKLSDNGLTLYVAVMPATSDGVYYDGYDYRFIGDIADKVILMAHDYAATDLTGFLNSTYYKTTALTPINSVYYSLRTACDKDSGVQDKSKLCLAISLSSLAWETDSSGKLTSVSPLHPSTATIYSRLTSGAIMGWSDTYCNPYITYTTENGQHIFLWYEDARSVSAKLTLARMLGITSVSVWRLGLIPAYSDDGLYYDVMGALG